MKRLARKQPHAPRSVVGLGGAFPPPARVKDHTVASPAATRPLRRLPEAAAAPRPLEGDGRGGRPWWGGGAASCAVVASPATILAALEGDGGRAVKATVEEVVAAAAMAENLDEAAAVSIVVAAAEVNAMLAAAEVDVFDTPARPSRPLLRC